MRLLYGVFGYGRGHASRALGVLPDLAQRHELLVLAGGDAYETLVQAGLTVTKIPTLEYAYDGRGKRCLWRSLVRNAQALRDLAFVGEGLRRVMGLARAFAPDVAIADAEPWTHQASARLRIPRISFDHFGVLTHCQPSIPQRDQAWLLRDRVAYRLAMGRPERIIVSSFYPAPPRSPRVRVVGPVLREEVLRLRPTRRDFLLVYLNRGQDQLVGNVERALRGLELPVVIYGCKRTGIDGNLDFRAPATDAFLDDLASCRAVFSTAGNQLVGEALHLGKPMLVMPENTIEQRVNARALEELGLGVQVALPDVSVGVLAGFLARELELRGRMRAAARNGRVEAIAALEQFAAELAPRTPSRRRAEAA